MGYDLLQFCLFYLNNNVIHSGNRWAVSLLPSTYKTRSLIYPTI
uniref:Uncharacterized protein n=1 Tax=Moniliophthora roreri TaxID=221103 RepID=A0A0W0FI68_MONRR